MRGFGALRLLALAANLHRLPRAGSRALVHARWLRAALLGCSLALCRAEVLFLPLGVEQMGESLACAGEIVLGVAAVFVWCVEAALCWFCSARQAWASGFKDTSAQALGAKSLCCYVHTVCRAQLAAAFVQIYPACARATSCLSQHAFIHHHCPADSMRSSLAQKRNTPCCTAARRRHGGGGESSYFRASSRVR